MAWTARASPYDLRQGCLLEDYKGASAALNTRVITVRGAKDHLHEQ